MQEFPYVIPSYVRKNSVPERRADEEDEDSGPSARYELRLSLQTLEYLKAIKKTGTYGRTVSTVVRSFIDAGVREAIDRKYISLTKDDAT